MEEERSAEARARAETALVRLLHEIGEEGPAVTVLGGLVPAVLAEGVEGAPAHIGTTDVDVLLVTHVGETHRLVEVENALLRLKFEPADADGWRWRGRVDGHVIKIEFLCDLEEHREGEYVRPPGCRQLAASNLRGTGYVSRDSEPRVLKGSLSDGRVVSVSTNFAGLAGYLLSKMVAVRTRAATKDFYDFIYVLMHNRAGGPAAAAQLMLEGPLADALPALRATFVEVRERFRRVMDHGPQQYADQAEQANPGNDPARLRADAVAAARVFFDTAHPDGAESGVVFRP